MSFLLSFELFGKTTVYTISNLLQIFIEILKVYQNVIVGVNWDVTEQKRTKLNDKKRKAKELQNLLRLIVL